MTSPDLERPRYMISIAAELRRHAPADAACVRAEGPRAPQAHGGQHAALLGAGRRAAEADPAADDGAGPQPRGRRAGAPPRGRRSGARRRRSTGSSAAAATRSPTCTATTGATSFSIASRHPRHERTHGLQQADRQEPGGRRCRAGACAPCRQPGDPSRAPAARAARPGAAAHDRRARRLLARRAARTGGGAARVAALHAGRREPPAADLERIPQGARPRFRGSAVYGGRVRLDGAPLARTRGSRAQRAPCCAQGGARRPAGHVAGPGGHLRGAREVRSRPDRAGPSRASSTRSSAATTRSAASSRCCRAAPRTTRC